MGLLTLRELSGLGGLGRLGSDDECGPRPELSSGERAECCPAYGWVVYDRLPYGVSACEAARREAEGESSESGRSPLDRVEEMRRALEDKRDAAEERAYKQSIEDMNLQMLLSRAKAQSAAKYAASPAGIAARKAEADRRAAAEKAKKNKQLLTYGAMAIAAAKIFAIF